MNLPSIVGPAASHKEVGLVSSGMLMEIEGLRRASEAVQSIVERIGYDGIARQISIRFHAAAGPELRA